MNTTPERSLAMHQRLYRTMLLAYPRAFRQVYGADMVQVFGDRLRAERDRRGRRASLRVWFLTLLDLFKTAPLQRMEKKMTREAAFAVLFAIFLLVTVAASAMGIGGGVVPFGIMALILAAVGLGISGAFKRDRSARAGGAGKLTGRDWWVVLAGLVGAVEIGAVTAQLIMRPSKENAFALAIVGAFGLSMLVGVWYRSRSRAVGDWLIVVGVLPFFGMWWMIWPAVLGLTVIVVALIDSTRGSPKDAAEETASV